MVNDWKEKFKTQTRLMYSADPLYTFEAVAEKFKEKFMELTMEFRDPNNINFLLGSNVSIRESFASFKIYRFGLEIGYNQDNDSIICIKRTPVFYGDDDVFEEFHEIKRWWENRSFLINDVIIDDLFRRAFEDYVQFDWGYKPK